VHYVFRIHFAQAGRSVRQCSYDDAHSFPKEAQIRVMVNMEKTGQPLLLTRGGFWTLPEFVSPENKFSWYTDVDYRVSHDTFLAGQKGVWLRWLSH
jgi:hypothetical protein